ncbi:hypothetical protein ACFL0Z_03800 [Patescibacteria group bacterium]
MGKNAWMTIAIILIVAIAGVAVYAFVGSDLVETRIDAPLQQQVSGNVPDCTTANGCYCYSQVVTMTNLDTNQTVEDVIVCEIPN